MASEKTVHAGAKRITITADLPADFNSPELSVLNSDIAKAMHGAKATNVQFSFEYPWGGALPVTKGKKDDGRPLGRSTGEDDEDSADEKPAGRGRGRPRKTDEDDDAERPVRRRRRSGSAEEEGAQTRRRRSRAEDAGDDEPEGTDDGDDEGDGKGQGRRRSSGRGAVTGGGNRSSRRVSEPEPPTDDDWGDDDEDEDGEDEDGDDAFTDEEMTANGEEWNAKTPGLEWPDGLTPKKVDLAALKRILAAHHEATGAEPKTLTFDVVQDTCGTRKVSEVQAKDYRTLAKALLKDTARYTYGVKKSASNG